ncbi:MAG TPA: hypothetical protein VK280_28765 [Streptosporangiaceae bacterium]|nr:hypothetical protein [Streptosporangiaceae bacterium]
MAQIEVTEDVIRDRAGEAVNGQRVSVHALGTGLARSERDELAQLQRGRPGYLSATMAGVR